MLIILIISCTNIEDTVEHDTVMSDVVPVIIIGGGASGLSVGIRLLELGISPLLLEKEAELGGFRRRTSEFRLLQRFGAAAQNR